jgi:O-antigen/teichoic acid export membrane protein
VRGTFKNAAFLFAGEAASRVFGFLTTALLARRLGVDGFGQIGFAAAVMAYGVVLTDIGLMTVGTREAARDRVSVPSLVGTIVPLRLVLGLGAGAVMVLLALVLPQPANVKWLLVLYATAVVVQSLVVEWVFIGIEKMAFVALGRILTNSAYFSLVLALVKSPSDILRVPLAFSAATVLGLLLLVAFLPSRAGLPRVSFRNWRPTLAAAWPIGASILLTQLHVNIGLVLLGVLAGFEQTGIYNSAYRLVFFLLALDRVFYTVYFPVVSRFMSRAPERLPELVGTALRMILVVALPLCAGAVILAGPVLGLVFGGRYLPAVPALRILVWFLPLSMLNSLAGYTIIGAGRERRFLRNTVIGVAASVVLSLAAVPLLHTAGAALALVAGELVLLLLMAADMLKLVRPRLEMRVLVPVAASAAMAVAAYLLRGAGVFWPVTAGAVVYCGLLLLLGGVTANDIGLVRNR